MTHGGTVSSTRTRGTPGRAHGAATPNVLVAMLKVASILVFFIGGAAKLLGTAAMVGLFNVIGVGHWFRYLTGAVEIVGAILLIVPPLAGVGALLLMAVMVGAITTEIFILKRFPFTPMAFLIILATIAWAHRDQAMRLVAHVRRRRSRA
jgi:putative oxidoreductase